MYLFPPPPEKKNRRWTPSEFEQELIVAKAFKRPPTNYVYDMPTYPYFPKQQPHVNFDLNFTE